MTEPLGISIVVVNYNNGRFLAAAIDSALGQDHPLCEVIVVDDCSADDSRAVIGRYGDRIRSILRETNGHQIAALNAAWPLAQYPILVFLDSDDLLLPHAASTIAGAWTAETVKAQFPLVSIDGAGQRVDHVAPKFPRNIDATTIRRDLLRAGQSSSSPGSGNAYSRLLLDRVREDGGFDLDNPRDYWMDNILECNAPFYGEIITINEPLVCYRMHDSNLFLQNTINHARFARMARSCTLKLDYLAWRCQKWGILFDATTVRDRSLWLLECRLAATKLARANDPRGDSIPNVLYHELKACVDDGGPAMVRITRALWFVGVALSPRGVSTRLLALRFLVTERPRWFEFVFARFTNVKAVSRPSGTPIPKNPAHYPMRGPASEYHEEKELE